jgi:hypothetical protein
MAQSSPIPNTTPECLPSAADRILWISANSPARLFIVRASINPGLPPLPFEAKKQRNTLLPLPDDHVISTTSAIH